MKKAYFPDFRGMMPSRVDEWIEQHIYCELLEESEPLNSCRNLNEDVVMRLKFKIWRDVEGVSQEQIMKAFDNAKRKAYPIILQRHDKKEMARTT